MRSTPLPTIGVVCFHGCKHRLAYAEKGYRGEGEIPSMPADLWVGASQRYIAIYEMLTGKPFEAGEYPVEPRLVSNLQAANLL